MRLPRADSAPTVHMIQQGPQSLEGRLDKIEKMLNSMQNTTKR